MDKPLVSVIIPNYNHETFLAKRISSVLNQDYDNLEVIILDDASEDESRQVIQNYVDKDRRITFVANETNSANTFRQWQKGIDLCSGGLIWIAESDDWADPKLVSEMIPFLADPEVGVTFCASTLVDADNQIIGSSLDLVDGDIIPGSVKVSGKEALMKYHAYYNLIPNASAAIFKKELASFSFLDKKPVPRLVGDKFFWFNILSKSSVVYLEKPLNNFRTHLNNVRSGTSDLDALEENLRFWRLLKRDIFNGNLPRDIIRRIVGWWGRLILKGEVGILDLHCLRIALQCMKIERFLPMRLMVFLIKTKLKNAG